MSECTPRIGSWVFGRAGAAASGDGRLRPQPQPPAPQRQPVQPVLAQAE